MTLLWHCRKEGLWPCCGTAGRRDCNPVVALQEGGIVALLWHCRQEELWPCCGTAGRNISMCCEVTTDDAGVHVLAQKMKIVARFCS